MSTREVLTGPRREALALLAEYHYLTTPDFYRLLGKSGAHEQRGIRRMLMLLSRAQLVERSRHAIDDPADPFLRYQYCYRLSRTGQTAIGKGHAAIEKSPASLAHELEITAFHIALNAGVPKTHRVYWLQTDLKRTVNPDALFAVTDTTRPAETSTFYYFLEVERSRQGHYRHGESGLLTKLRRYADYRRSELCRSEWRHFADFRVIVVLPTRERQVNLLQTLRTTLSSPMIWTATAEDVQRDICGSMFRAPPDFEVDKHSIIQPQHGGKDV
jgi:hypothetical protein